MNMGINNRILLGLCLCVSLAAAEARELEDKKWSHASSAHFEIYSRLGKSETTNMLKLLEAVRQLSLIMQGASEDEDDGIPTLIVAVKTSKEFGDVGGNEDYAGLFMSGLRQNAILLRGGRYADTELIILHEYVHYRMSRFDGFAYPHWFHEGFADYLGSTRIHKGKLEVFYPPRGRLMTLSDPPWLDAEDLLQESRYADLSTRQVGRFYAQSWALVHFLHNREAPAPRPSEALTAYANYLRAGDDELAAFEKAFQLPVDDLNRTLRRYVDKDCCKIARINIEELLPTFNPVFRPADRSDIAYALARVAARLDNFEGAERWYAVAGADPRYAGIATSARGLLKLEQDEPEAALELLEQAYAMAPDDPVVLLDWSQYWFRQLKDGDPAIAAMHEERARQGFRQLSELGTNSAEYLARSSEFLLHAGGDAGLAVEQLETARRMLPSSVEILSNLAQGYVAIGRFDDAIAAARTVQAWSHGRADVNEWAEQLIALVREQQRQEQAYDGD